MYAHGLCSGVSWEMSYLHISYMLCEGNWKWSFEIGGYGERSYFESAEVTQPRMSGHLAPTVYTTVKGYY